MGKSQLGAILNGQVGRLPDCQAIRGLVDSYHRYARSQGRSAKLSRRFGIYEYWRPPYFITAPSVSSRAVHCPKPGYADLGRHETPGHTP